MKVFLENAHSLSDYRLFDAVKRYSPPEVEFVSAPNDADICIVRSVFHNIPPFDYNKPLVYHYESCEVADSVSQIKTQSKSTDVLFSFNLALIAQLQNSPVSIFYHPYGVSDAFYPLATKEIVLSVPTPTPFSPTAMPSGSVGTDKKIKYEVFFYSPHNREMFSDFYKILHAKNKTTLCSLKPEDVPLTENIAFDFAFPILEDEKLNKLYNHSRFTADYHSSGIGMGGIEGLMAGALPIIHDTENTREIYRQSACYIRPGFYYEDFEKIIDSDVKWDPARAEEVKSRLHYKVTMKYYWDKILEKYL